MRNDIKIVFYKKLTKYDDTIYIKEEGIRNI